MTQEQRIEYFMSEIARLSNQIVDLQDERDALKEQNAALAAQVEVAQELLKCWQTWLGASRAQCDDSGQKLWDRIELVCATPQQHLANLMAEAVESAIKATPTHKMVVDNRLYHSQSALLQYADSIRQEVK